MSTMQASVAVVDDDVFVLKALDRLLQSAGFAVETFTSAQDFLGKCPANTSGCVVTDLSMPGFGGLDLQQALAKALDSRPIVFISGQGDVPGTIEAMKAGAADFLTKPIDGDKLVVAVRAALQRFAAAQVRQAEQASVTTRMTTLTARERELQSGVPTAMVLGWYFSNCSEALIGAGLVRALVPGPLRLDTLRSAGIFLASAVLAAPLLSSFIDAGLVRLIGWGESGYWDLVRTRLFSNVLAELTIVPLIVAWAAFLTSPPREVPRARYAEVAALFGGLLLVCVLVFDLPQRGSSVSPGVY